MYKNDRWVVNAFQAYANCSNTICEGSDVKQHLCLTRQLLLLKTYKEQWRQSSQLQVEEMGIEVCYAFYYCQKLKDVAGRITHPEHYCICAIKCAISVAVP